VEVGHLQAKFTRPFLAPHSSTFGLLGSLERRLVAKVGKHLNLQGYNSKLSLLRVRGSGELVEKVGRSSTGESTISHKAEVLSEE
jgi:hypothetical protein